MRILIACFFVLFALAELFDWMQQLSLPMPIYILGGAFLAIASNYNKRFGSFFGASTQSGSFINSSYSPTESISYQGDRTEEQYRLNEKH